MPEPGRHADADIADDLVLPFRAEASGVMGRLVRLGPAIDDILTRHGYPEPVSLALGEAIALAAMLGAALKVDAKFTLQTKCDGPLSMLLVNYESPGALRGLASFDAGRLGVLGDRPDGGALLGRGHLAMTIDPGGNRDRYQGIVALDGVPLAEAALAYFRQSEQLPTFIRLAVARHFDRDAAGSRRWHWRAGGLMLQHLSAEGGDGRQERDRLRGDGLGFEPDDDWERTRILAATVEDVRSGVRDKLLLADGEKPPRILEYAGRGRLRREIIRIFHYLYPLCYLRPISQASVLDKFGR